MMRSLKPALIALTVLAACIAGGLYAYHKLLRKVRIAFVGYEDVAWAAVDAAAQRTPYAVHRIERADLDHAALSSYNAVFLFGMGLNLTPDQIQMLDGARQAGAKIVVTSATNNLSSAQTNVTKTQEEAITSFFRHGGEQNHVALLHYVARELAGRDVEVPPLVKTPETGFFYLGGQLFATLAEFEQHVARHGPKLPSDAPRVALLGPFVRPKEPFSRKHLDYLIHGFERRGVRIYPMFGSERTSELLQQVKPDLAIVFPHGRLARNNAMPDVLAALNVPCMSGLMLSGSVEEWTADERGMAAGALGQSIAMPELDGAIEPLAILSHEPNERGLRVPEIIPDRIERFMDRAVRWLELRRKPNSEKRVVIVYYKAPGLASLSAAGLEVCPSLLNVLRRLEQEGYDLGGPLPATPEELFELIQKKGKTLGQWAIGSYEKFLEEAEPEFVPAATYAQWFQRTLSERRQKDVLDLWGAIPGQQMVAQRDGQPCLVVSRIRLGNVVLMPQPTVGGGDEVKSIHGTDQAPPHFYLGAYLWARFGFRADAIVHFGTHGSLEFTYGKSAALSRDCWPDILIGDLPHVYPYIINNVGEALVAKRRSYSVTVSHLTPPFTESGLYGELAVLQQKVEDFETVEDPRLRRELAEAIRAAVQKLELAAELGIAKDDLASRPLTEEELERLDDYMHQLQEQSITDGLHVLGRALTREQVHSTVTQMLGEQAIDTTAAAADGGKGQDLRTHGKDLARALVDGLLDGKWTLERFFGAEKLSRLRAARQDSGAGPPHRTGAKRPLADAPRGAERTEDGPPHSEKCGCPACRAWVAARSGRSAGARRGSPTPPKRATEGLLTGSPAVQPLTRPDSAQSA